jgi:hypothetical protein
MKRILIILTILSTTLVSCESWLDVNDNPNVPTEVTTELVLPAAEASIAVQVGGMLFNTGGFYAQYWSQAPEANQYNGLDKFDVKTDFLDNQYTELYAGALNDLEYIRTASTEQEDWGNYLVATVLRAYTYQLLVDLIDKVPYTESLQGTGILNPVFDDGKVVYDGLITELDDALGRVTGSEIVASTDMLLGADIDEWIGFANAMKLKIFMRQSETASNHSAEVKALIDANNFMSMDVMFASFADEQNKRNPWYDTEVDRLGGVNHVATHNIISYLKSTADPRLETIWAAATVNDQYNGNFPAGKTIPGIKNEDFSFPIVGATQPIYLYTMSELYFFIAEAELRYNNDATAAKAAYESAIDASIALHGIATPGSELYGAGKPIEFNETHKQIMMQKWVSLALVNNIEAWFEIKRTEYPSISDATVASIQSNPDAYTPGDRIKPYENTLGDGKWLTRFYYPDAAVSSNENTPSQPALTDKVWWDQN